MADESIVTPPEPTGSVTPKSVVEPAPPVTPSGNWLDNVTPEIKGMPEFEALLKDSEAFKAIEKVPEKPEDYKIEGLEGEMLEGFGKMAQEIGLTQSQAVKFHEMTVKALADNLKAKDERLAQQKETLKADTMKAMNATYGADAAKVEATAREAIGRWGDPALLELLDKTGLLYHQSVLNAFFRIGQIGQPDIIIPGAKPMPQVIPDNSGRIPDSNYKKE